MSDDFVIVKYDYLAQEDQELTIKKNERLRLLDDSRNWWKVVNDSNNVGFVPSNYVRKEVGQAATKKFPIFEQDPDRSNGSDTRLAFGSNNNSYTSSPSTNNKSIGIMTRTKAIAKFSYEPRLEDELKLTKGDIVYVVEKSTDGWWKGENGGSTGWFPSNYVDEVENSNGNQQIENQTPPSAPLPTVPQDKPVLETVVALYSFEANGPEELSFVKGERLDIVGHPSYDPDWWCARNARGDQGLVPRNYIEVTPPGGIPTPQSWEQPRHEVPMVEEPWYFGKISREEADRLLDRGLEGEYLVRESESNPGDLSISLRGIERNKHFKVQTVDGQLKIGNRSFPNMEELLYYYTTHAMFFFCY
ncbi:unnamed protein product [Caenorhabditis auriculariae]|uniref:Uncharacterized protein n=1 Tax=Caenorhabditis auriculariae TaxID=2777116 RepID=A0A8S1GP90_9PELO|nr:unnamed protein product [Caenorhabditis auriculariae]